MSVTVLPQLVEAEANLSEQETALMQQLTAIQEQRKGLQTVISMFEASDGDVDISTEKVAETVAAKLARVTKSKSTARKAKVAKTPKAAKAARAAKAAKTPKVAKTPKAVKTAKAKTVRKSTSTQKVDGRSARWQRYVRDDYRQKRLPDAVADVLKTKPKASFKISDVMLTIFEDNMPKTQHLKARNRISNILSAGARDKDWYRGRGGTYSLSKTAVKTR